MKRCLLIPIVVFAAALALFSSAMPASAQSGQPVVRGVLFWSATCPHCHYVIDEVLPPLQAKYGDQLDIVMVELNSQESADRFYAAGAALGVARDHMGVPMMIVGDHLMMGSAQIPDELPGLIESYLASGGVDIPSLPGLEGLAGAAVDAPLVTPVPEPMGMSGAIPAFIILVGLAGSLIFIAIRLTMARKQGAWPQGMAWLDWFIPALAIFGLAVAAYMTYVEVTAVEAVCGPFGDCNTVQSSAYAKFLGIPVGVIGLAGYLAILAAWLWGRSGNATARMALLAMAVIGVIFSIYLTWLELFVIQAVCLWCLTSAVIMMILAPAAAAWLALAWAPRQRKVRGRPAQG